MAARRKTTRKNNKGLITRDLYLNTHDEEKVLLFTAGIVFGVGVSTYLMQGETVFTGLTLIIIGLVLAFIEARQQTK